jgi:hypothetical protein
MSDMEAHAPAHAAPRTTLLAQAKEFARTGDEPLLSVLERLGEFSPDEMLLFTAGESGMPVRRLAQMQAMIPDFSVFSYAECLKQNWPWRIPPDLYLRRSVERHTRLASQLPASGLLRAGFCPSARTEGAACGVR